MLPGGARGSMRFRRRISAKRGDGTGGELVVRVLPCPSDVERGVAPSAVQHDENERAIRVAERDVFEAAFAKSVGFDTVSAGDNKLAYLSERRVIHRGFDS